MTTPTWYQEESDDEFVSQEDYDISSIPNDFNVRTIFDLVNEGLVSIPGFQRNYVWDIKRASKLIESVIIGLPIPQIFLYEEARNKYAVIDGQQRLMSIYYFKKKRFPREEKRSDLRKIIATEGTVPDRILEDDTYFSKFNLQLPSALPNRSNKFNKLNYDTLEEYRTQFDLRTIRNIVIRQNSPNDDDNSSIYEIFNRLNTGGVTLTPQEIRVSLYHSDFYSMLSTINQSSKWRELIGLAEADLHVKDIEFLLRAFSMLWYSPEYKPSMIKFLNSSSLKFKRLKKEDIDYCQELFTSFLDACSELGKDAFISSGKFYISIFEAVFVATAKNSFNNRTLITTKIAQIKLDQLKADSQFLESIRSSTTSKANVEMRINKAIEILGGDE